MIDRPENPIVAAQMKARQELPRRFYKKASVEREGEGFALKLDGRTARTPARKPLVVRGRTLAEALAAEWNDLDEHIDPGRMPLTRLINAAIDRVSGETDAVRADIVAYAGSDMLCYRAEGPEGLVAAQDVTWSPLVTWAREALGARLILAEGVMHVAQDEGALAAIERAVAPFDPLALAALHIATTLTGSAVIALALAHGRISADEAWTAAHVDEDWEMARWGSDELALARRAARRAEFDAAALVLDAARAGGEQ